MRPYLPLAYVLLSAGTLLLFCGASWFSWILFLLGMLGIYGRKDRRIPVLLSGNVKPFIFFALLFGCIGIVATIPSNSMRPTLFTGDYVWVSKLPFQSFKRGDVLVFKENGTLLIKRLVATGGDIVEYRNRQLFVNGKSLQGNKVGEDRYSGPMRDRTGNVYREGEYLISVASDGDETAKPVNTVEIQNGRNREQCEYGEDYIKCLVPGNHYFMMGDNRDNSIDSRYFGAVSKNDIIGRAVVVLFNLDNQGRVWKTL